MSETVYLESVEIRNFRCIEFLRMDTDAPIVLVTGENQQGKTSVLQAIADIFEGGHHPDSIRHGTDLATIVLKLNDGTTITKTIDREGYELIIKTAEGGIVGAPKTYLERIAAIGSFDPISFIEADPKVRAKMLLDRIPLTFEASEVNPIFDVPRFGPHAKIDLVHLNELRDGVYAERRDINVSIRDLEGTIRDMEKSLPEKTEGIEGSTWGEKRDELSKRIGEINAELQSIEIEREDKRKIKVAEIEQVRRRKLREVQIAFETELARLRSELDLKTAGINDEADFEIKNFDRALEEAHRALRDDLQNERNRLSLDLGEARSRAEADDKVRGLLDAIAGRKKALEGILLKELRLTKQIEELDKVKALKLREVPIEGLDIRIDKKGKPIISINQTPIDILSGKEAVFFAVRVASLEMKRLPLMILESREVSNTNLKILADALGEAGIQILMARWMDGKPLRVMAADQYFEEIEG